ncbi:MAG: ABC transporter ATP-binding protein [Firmicutes bacterium]|nr:ABC transporter ATP-binding protein [Bacillota bacterium]MCL2255753.1 ABC transporter ATP-binding protein [Bacillota bacterium]
MKEIILELKHVSKKFKDFSIEDVSFYLPKGYIMGFIGSNGAGKTSIIKLILNMLKLDSGSIEVFGKNIIENNSTKRDRIGIVMDSSNYVEDWTLFETEKALKPFYSKWDSLKFKELLLRFSLDEKKKIKDLSRGMKMKFMFACALAHDPDLLILDEITTGLDAESRAQIIEILQTFIINEEKSILFSTHITADLEKIADYITLINNGKILYSNTKDKLLERFVLIKGKVKDLKQNQKSLIMGYNENEVGFDGIIEVECSSEFKKTCLIEKSTLDDIVTRFKLGGNENE